eukprot:47832-Eustigmatos_ZCMA.PRE.1
MRSDHRLSASLTAISLLTDIFMRTMLRPVENSGGRIRDELCTGLVCQHARRYIRAAAEILVAVVPMLECR